MKAFFKNTEIQITRTSAKGWHYAIFPDNSRRFVHKSEIVTGNVKLCGYCNKVGTFYNHHDRCRECYFEERRCNKAPSGRKFCPGCKETLLKSEFWKKADKADGLQPYCKTCSRKRKYERM